MAHQTNVTQVKSDFQKSKNAPESVIDPICGAKMTKRESKHMLFRGEDVFHFCSRACMDQYIKTGGKKKIAA